jgi:FMN phosphatase YigB (HAD superfamily)
MLKAITFDFWMTLYLDPKGALKRKRDEARRALLEDYLSQHNVRASFGEQHRAWAHAGEVFDELWRRHHRALPTEQRLQIMFNRMRVDYTARELRGLSRAYEDCTLRAPPRLIPGVRDVIRQLAGRYRLAIICDTGITPGRVLRRVLERDGLLRCFTHCVFSDEKGSTKPDVRNFQAALKKLRAKPEEAAHVGDLIRTDIRGAQRAGMHALLFTGITHYSKRELQNEERRGVRVVQKFRDIPRTVSGL